MQVLPPISSLRLEELRRYQHAVFPFHLSMSGRLVDLRNLLWVSCADCIGDRLPRDMAHKVKARIAQFEGKCILPINALLNGFGCLSIRQAFNKLENAHQGEAPGRFCRLPTRRE